MPPSPCAQVELMFCDWLKTIREDLAAAERGEQGKDGTTGEHQQHGGPKAASSLLSLGWTSGKIPTAACYCRATGGGGLLSVEGLQWNLLEMWTTWEGRGQRMVESQAPSAPDWTFSSRTEGTRGRTRQPASAVGRVVEGGGRSLLPFTPEPFSRCGPSAACIALHAVEDTGMFWREKNHLLD